MTVTVNGTELEEQRVEREVALLRTRYGNQPVDEQQILDDARENAIEKVLLEQEAQQRMPEIDDSRVDEEVARWRTANANRDDVPDDALREGIGQDIRLRTLFDELCSDIPAPSEDDVKAFYDENPVHFTQPEQITCSHIVKHPAETTDSMSQLAEMMNIHQQLTAGADFAELAAAHSDCPDKAGDLGSFPRGTMVDEFDDVAFKLKPGQFSDVFETQFGWHIVFCREQHPGATQPLDEVRDHIAEHLLIDRKNACIGSFVDKLKTDADIARD